MTEWGMLIRQKRAKGGALSKEEARRLDEERGVEIGRRLHSFRVFRQRLAISNLINAFRPLSPLDRNREQRH